MIGEHSANRDLGPDRVESGLHVSTEQCRRCPLRLSLRSESPGRMRRLFRASARDGTGLKPCHLVAHGRRELVPEAPGFEEALAHGTLRALSRDSRLPAAGGTGTMRPPAKAAEGRREDEAATTCFQELRRDLAGADRLAVGSCRESVREPASQFKQMGAAAGVGSRGRSPELRKVAAQVSHEHRHRTTAEVRLEVVAPDLLDLFRRLSNATVGQ